MIHDMDITKWPNKTFARWIALVDQMPSLDGNKKVVYMAKVEDRTAKLAGFTLTAANTTTM